MENEPAIQRLIIEAARTAWPMFRMNQWHWGVRNGQRVEPYVPSLTDVTHQLERTVYELLNSDENVQGIRGSRFFVEREAYEDQGPPWAGIRISLELGAVYDD